MRSRVRSTVTPFRRSRRSVDQRTSSRGFDRRTGICKPTSMAEPSSANSAHDERCQQGCHHRRALCGGELIGRETDRDHGRRHTKLRRREQTGGDRLSPDQRRNCVYRDRRGCESGG